MYWFLAVTLVAIVATSLRADPVEQAPLRPAVRAVDARQDLARTLITTRESTLRELARELHDEFGQLLTAVGTMLARVARRTPRGSPMRADLREIGEVAQTALDNVRGLSQALHPSILEELGLDAAVDWYVSTVERQLGVAVDYTRRGHGNGRGCRRRHPGLPCAAGGAEQRGPPLRHRDRPRCGWTSATARLMLDVEDTGKGLDPQRTARGLGLVTMRERAELVGGTLGVRARRERGHARPADVPLWSRAVR